MENDSILEGYISALSSLAQRYLDSIGIGESNKIEEIEFTRKPSVILNTIS